jgi:uncharacterized SAM-binding protein YcdF (DUF218 family)
VFWLKKAVSYWLMPLPLSLALLAGGLLLACSARHSRASRRLLLAAAVLLALLSNRFVSTHLLRPLEELFPAVPEFAEGAPAPAPVAGCRFVVVLGSDNVDAPGMPATSRLYSSGLARIVEAVRILRVLPGARLIVSGPSVNGRPSHASVLAQAAESLGVSPARITQIETARDTEEESLAVARLAGHGRTALVTSAWHMPRAAGLFRKAGVDFVPCPTDYASRSDSRLEWMDARCDVESLERSTLAIHEYLGLLWLRLRGAV